MLQRWGFSIDRMGKESKEAAQDTGKPGSGIKAALSVAAGKGICRKRSISCSSRMPQRKAPGRRLQSRRR